MPLLSSTSEGHPRVCGSTENRANEFPRGNQLLKLHSSGTIGQKRGLVESSEHQFKREIGVNAGLAKAVHLQSN
jgi:hypothetical protein